MRSLIKMEVTRYPILDVSPTPKLPYNQDLLKRNGAVTHHSSRPHTQTKRNSVYTPSNRSFIGEETFSFVRSQNEREDVSSRLRTSQQKRCIEKFISGLANDIEDPNCEPSSGENKLKILKKIIENYDIKNLQKNQYSKLIKTFGLQIESAKTAEKQKNGEIKSASPVKNSYRKFQIRSTQKDRLFKLKNKIQGQSAPEVALFQFSQDLTASEESSKVKGRKFSIKNHSENLRIVNSSRQDSSRSNSPQKQSPLKYKKISPFKYRSKQDVIVEKVNKYRQFIFALNYSNYVYRSLDIEEYPKTIKYYIGPGNNSNLVRSLMKKRHWFEETNKIKQANFIWTQLKIEDIFKLQESNQEYLKNIQHRSGFHLQKISTTAQKSTQQLPQKTKRSIIITTKRNNLTEDNLKKVINNKDTIQILKFMQTINNKKNNPCPFSQKLKFCERKLNDCSELASIVHNHFQCNGIIGNKKGMFYCMKEYYKLVGRDVWNVLPLTFHISKGVIDNEYKNFLGYYQQRKKQKLQNVWIMKPGQFSNRGNGISCSNKLDQIKKRVMKCQTIKKGDHVEQKTIILQLYITNPLLYNGRKFDIRVFVLATCHNGKIKAYWYQEGYVRTSGYMFNLHDLADTDIHLTNDAIQKQAENYGKYEAGNKLSYTQLQRYLDSLPAQGRNLDIISNLVPKMKRIAADAIKSSFLFLDQQRKQNNFEIFGLDFMVDYHFNPWLIEINTNPCLELSCPLLERIIPYMLQNSLRIAVDTVFPPPQTFPQNYKYNIPENAAHYNKYELIFDQDRDGPAVRQLFDANLASKQIVASLMNIEQQKQVFAEEGIIRQYDL